jgi:ribonucleoside-diphosphate reductase alpha chain
MTWATALTRMVSAIFRKGGDVSFVAGELKAVFDPRGGYWEEKRYVPSLIAGIGEVIEKHLSNLGVGVEPAAVLTAAKHCPQCQTGALTNKEGCWCCNQCTYASCG